MSSKPPLRARALLDALVAEGVTHVVGLPDTRLGLLFSLLDRRRPGVARSRSATGGKPRLVRVTREGEAFGVAAGLWLGGRTPVVAIQSTGLLESGDALRGTVQRMGAPIVAVVTHRGYAKMVVAELAPPTLPHLPANLVRADVDSAALLLEPTLGAWGVPFRLVGEEGDESVVPEVFALAERERRPVALVVTGLAADG